MLWVPMAGILPALESEASARWPRPSFAAANVGSIAKHRRHASSRASWLATNSSNGIGRLRVHNPPGERKSGIPHSVEMPAPVKGTIVDDSAIISPSRSTPLRRSDAIIGIIRKLGRADYSTATRIATSMPPGIVLMPRTFCPNSGRVCDLIRCVAAGFAARFVALLLVALLGLCCRSGRRGFFRRLAVLGQSFHFGFELGMPCRYLFRQLLDCPVAQRREFFDVE